MLNREINGGKTVIGRLHEDFSTDNAGSADISINGEINADLHTPRAYRHG